MLQLFQQVQKACRQRLGVSEDAEQGNAYDTTPPLASSIRRLRAMAEGTSVRRSPAGALAAVVPEDAAPPKQLKPILYPTPDGALRPASGQRKSSKPTLCSSESFPASMTPDDLRGSRREQSSPNVRRTLGPIFAEDVSSPPFTAAVESNRETSLRRRSLLAVAVDNGLMETLIRVCTPTKLTTETQDDVFTLEERVEALYTIVYLAFYTDNGRSMRQGNNCEERQRNGKGEEENTSLVCKLDLFQLAATACDVLKRVVEQTLGPGRVQTEGKNGQPENERDAQTLHALVVVANTFFILLGCQNPSHWQEEEDGWDMDEATMSYLDVLSKKTFSLHETTTQDGYCCLCSDADSSSYQFMMTALIENGLWQYLLRHVAFSFLSRPGVSCESQNHLEEPIAGNNQREASEYQRIARHLGVCLTLKIMTLLLLRSVAAVDRDLSNILCCLTPAEEEELEFGWHRAFSRLKGEEKNHPPLSLMEKQFVFTLRRLSGFLVFRRLSCLAANAMHILFTRLLLLPAPINVDVHVVLIALFVVEEHPPAFLMQSPTMRDETTTSPSHLRGIDTSAGPRKTANAAVVSDFLNHLLHLFSFNLALQRKKEGGRFHRKQRSIYAVKTTNTELTLSGALLSVVLLLEQKQQERKGKIVEEHRHRHACSGISIEAMMTRHNVYRACEESPDFQTAFSAGLGRTHQVILLLSAISAQDGAAVVPLTTLRLEGNQITAFSHLVHPNDPLPSALHRRMVESEAWAETLTVGVRSSASITASAAAVRRKKSETTFSCTLTCPVRLGTLNRHRQGFKEALNNGNAVGGDGLSDRVLQVYLKAPYTEESTGAKTISGGANKATCVASSEDSPPPMFFGYEPASLKDGAHAGGGSGNHNNHNISGGGKVETMFVNGDPLKYTQLVHNMSCSSSLQRTTMTYTAAVNLTIVTTSCEEGEEEVMWPFDAVILACSTVHGDELQLSSQPPQKFICSPQEEKNKASLEPRGINEGEAQSRHDRRRKVALRRGTSPPWAGAKGGKVLLCQASRRDRDATASAESSSCMKEKLSVPNGNDPEADANCSHHSHENGASQSGQNEEEDNNNNDDDNMFTDLDAYVAKLKPLQVIDVGLQRKEQEVALLQQQLEQSKAREASLQQRLQEVLVQREELISSLTDRRVEVELCHKEIIAPLRREVTLLRHSLSLRNQEMSSVTSLCQMLRDENASMAEIIRDFRGQLESLAQNAEHQK
ncbi:hypothetical protein MOQ_006006 [Trypanosoma cruzi marinkellei]|uniref:Uncharacterized protein n=1 Tax=Trypanosoma cruzi marinkellei TaxID=85056 RepID=K2MT13_TRYCR|nr:hypothetical protein MOQ_006006 [Trypanosoma cruzi marinkellei]